MYEDAQTRGLGGNFGLALRDTNPTLNENISTKIKYYQDEIARLQAIQKNIPESMLSMNLRDLREAMNF